MQMHVIRAQLIGQATRQSMCVAGGDNVPIYALLPEQDVAQGAAYEVGRLPLVAEVFGCLV